MQETDKSHLHSPPNLRLDSSLIFMAALDRAILGWNPVTRCHQTPKGSGRLIPPGTALLSQGLRDEDWVIIETRREERQNFY
jgi:hypothetical protein